MDIDNINILEDDLILAQALCSSISDSNIRNRSVANIVGAKIASRFFDDNYQIDSETGLHNITNILEEFDISDIYFNNSYVDVRVYFSEDELCVPKSHFDLNILPTVYMFIKINPNLTEGSVTGFIKPENVNKEHLIQGYYYIREDSLASFYDIESLLSTTLDTFELPNELIYRYLENSLDTDAKIDVFRELLKSKSSRIKLAKLIKAQSVLNSVFLADSDKQDADSEYDDKETAQNSNLDNLYAPAEEVKTEEEELLEALDYTTEITPSNAELLNEQPEADSEQAAESDESQEPKEELETLFTGEQEGIPAGKKKSSNGFAMFLIILLIAVGGYYAYVNYGKQAEDFSQNTIPEITEDGLSENVEPAPQQEAMPVETVETVPSDVSKKEEAAAAVAIPAIEKHLDASVLVSNLRVEWEIPVGYANNTSAKRYLYKLGKIIQLNLKSDLLLLNKPPLSNRITVELKFNPNLSNFELVGIKDSSGERTVDNAIMDTIRNVLNMHVSTNAAFEKLQGNPVLIIRL